MASVELIIAEKEVKCAVELGGARFGDDLRSAVTVTDRAAELSTSSADNLDTVTLNRDALDDLPIFDQDYIGTMSRFLDAGAVATGGVTLVVDGLEASCAGALRTNGLNVVAIHHHMTAGQPAIYFLHYWGTGPAAQLAGGFKAALNELGKGSVVHRSSR
jgi:hypothetical protein